MRKATYSSTGEIKTQLSGSLNQHSFHILSPEKVSHYARRKTMESSQKLKKKNLFILFHKITLHKV